MPRLQPVDAGMFDDIHAELLRLLDPTRDREEWRRIFEYPWRPEGVPHGYGLFEGSEPVAFMGTIFAEREVDGRRHPFCNVSSWIAKEPYQSESALLVLQLRKYPEHTITNLSANETASRVFTRLGFETLDTHRTVIYPVGLMSRVVFKSELSCRHGFGLLEGVVSDGERRILEDHRDIAHHALAWSDESYCYVVYTIGAARGLRRIHIHHISHPGTFVTALPSLQRQWLRHHGAAVAECDARLVSGHTVPFSRTRPLNTPRLFRDAPDSPEHIDNLYSEIVLLDLS